MPANSRPTVAGIFKSMASLLFVNTIMYHVWSDYYEVNQDLKQWGFNLKLDNDQNVEDPKIIVGVENASAPDWPHMLGYDLGECIVVNDKLRLYIYTE